MLIECVLKRDAPVEVSIGNETYKFEPDAYGRRVAEVWREDHQEMFLSSGASHLYRQADTNPAPSAMPPAVPPSLEKAGVAAEEPANHALHPGPPDLIRGFADPSPPPLSPEAERMVGLGGNRQAQASSRAELKDDDLEPGKTKRTRLFATARKLGIPITGMMTNSEVERLIVEKRDNVNA